MLQKFTKRRNMLTAAMLLCFCAFTNKAMAWEGNGTANNPWKIGDTQTNTATAVTAVLNGNTLTISGTGNMADFWYSSEGEAPWYYEFYSNYSLITNIDIQSGVTNIGDRAFHNLKNLTTITIPSTVTIIGKQAFYMQPELGFNNTSLKSIKIPNSVKNIEGEAFRNCSGLETVTIENGHDVLNFLLGWFPDYYETFTGCPIKILHLGRNYTNLPFSGISTLQTLTIGSTVTEIGGNGAFYYCHNLKNVTIQDGTDALIFKDEFPYQYFSSPIETLYLGRNIDNHSGSYGSPFMRISALKMLTIGNNVTSINNYSFQDCNGLTQIISNNPNLYQYI